MFHHYMCKLFYDSNQITDEMLKSLINEALIAASATIVDSISYAFEPQGLTSIWLLSESHASIHTWPENNIAMIDYFSCAEDPKISKFSEVLITKYSRIIEEKTIYR